jgi:hypothetical protein
VLAFCLTRPQVNLGVRPHQPIMSRVTEDALKVLVDLPMWHAGFAGSTAWFQFGAAVVRPDHHGGERTVGEYALHLSGRWQWIAPSGFVRADDESAQEALATLGTGHPCVGEFEVMQTGELILQFTDGDALHVYVGDDATDEEVEYWRLFRPGTLAPHFVVSSTGAQWDEV